MLDKVVFGAIGGGVIAVGAGITMFIAVESRLSKLETQIGFILGASVSMPSSTLPSQEGSGPMPSSEIAAAISQQCAQLMAQYSGIVEQQLGISTSDSVKLDALSRLIDQLGCGELARR